MAQNTQRVYVELIVSVTIDMDRTDWRLPLHNLLQSTYGTGQLTWELYQEGPQHNTPWIAIARSRTFRMPGGKHRLTAVATVNGVECGRGAGWKQGDAKEQAARQAYAYLYKQLYNQDPPTQ